MTSRFIVFLGNAAMRDIPLLGGKGANLEAASQAGFPVPPGFVVTTKAYMAFLERNALQKSIGSVLASVDFGDLGGLTDKSSTIEFMIASAKLPADIALQINAAYSRLCTSMGVGHLSVAVRSSATAEDLKNASFAGQHTTLLNVKDESGVIDAVKKCWASLYTPRAMAYRHRMGIDSEFVSMAVVVQLQISSEKAGIGFTVNPLNGDKNQIVIDAGYGQGEAFVSGAMAADTFLLDKRTGSVLEQAIGKKTEMMSASSDVQGLEVRQVPESLQSASCLNNDELDSIRKLAVDLENHYGYPQDFEWAIAEGRLLLLQTRPVTTLEKR